MKKQKKLKALNLFNDSIKLNEKREPHNDFFPFSRNNSKVNAEIKSTLGVAYHKTECNSPVEYKSKRQNFFLPDIEPNQKILPFSLGIQRRGIGAKTVKFLDSLINILKDQEGCSLKQSINRKLVTDKQPFFEKKSRNKPKILQNKFIKQFFNKPQQNRREVVSQSCSRRMSRKTEPIQQYTFYGASKPKLSILKQPQFQQVKSLNQLRKSKLQRAKETK